MKKLLTFLIGVVISSFVVFGQSSKRTEVWRLTELVNKDTREDLYWKKSDTLNVAFFGEYCFTVDGKCSSLNGALFEYYLSENEYAYKMRAADYDSCNVELDLFRKVFDDFNYTFRLREEEDGSITILSRNYEMIFVSSISKKDYYCYDLCSLVPSTGICRAYLQTYYYNQEKGQCDVFINGGCQDVIAFETMEECQNACGR